MNRFIPSVHDLYNRPEICLATVKIFLLDDRHKLRGVWLAVGGGRLGGGTETDRGVERPAAFQGW